MRERTQGASLRPELATPTFLLAFGRPESVDLDIERFQLSLERRQADEIGRIGIPGEANLNSRVVTLFVEAG